MSEKLSILRRPGAVGWCLYDAGNSAFSTSVIVALLPGFFTKLFADPKSVELHLGRLTWHTSSDALWAYSNGAFMILSALVAPVLGAMADFSRSKKRFLAGCMVLGAAFTGLLAGVGPGQYLLCMAVYIVAGFFWSAGNVFYDGFIPELAPEPADMDALSSAGYAAGYLGGGLMLAINLLIVSQHARLGLDKAAAARLNFILVAGWWAALSIPLLLAVREGRRDLARPAAAGTKTHLAALGKAEGGQGVAPVVAGSRLVREGFARIAATVRKVRRLPELSKFLLAFFLYHSGIGTLVIVVAKFASSELNLTDSTIVGCILMIQFIAMPAALLFILLAERIGRRNSIFLGLAVFIGVVIYAMNIHTAAQFWVLGGLVALVLGGTQAISRSVYGSMIPPGMSAEFYGFFSIFNKVGTFVGPVMFGLIRDLTGSSRLAILFLIVFFVLGFLVLLTVRVQKGIEQGRAMEMPNAKCQMPNG